MSVFEPHTDAESGGRSQLPPLDVPLRGRKGQQVTAYIQDLATRLGRQRTRAEQAEQAATHLQRELAALRNQPPPSFEHLGCQAAEQMLAKADGERSVMDAETNRLREYRDGLLGHLSRVEADLAGFLADVSDSESVESAKADRADAGSNAKARAKAAPRRQSAPAADDPEAE